MTVDTVRKVHERRCGVSTDDARRAADRAVVPDAT